MNFSRFGLVLSNFFSPELIKLVVSSVNDCFQFLVLTGDQLGNCLIKLGGNGSDFNSFLQVAIKLIL